MSGSECSMKYEGVGERSFPLFGYFGLRQSRSMKFSSMKCEGSLENKTSHVASSMKSGKK